MEFAATGVLAVACSCCIQYCRVVSCHVASPVRRRVTSLLASIASRRMSLCQRRHALHGADHPASRAPATRGASRAEFVRHSRGTAVLSVHYSTAVDRAIKLAPCRIKHIQIDTRSSRGGGRGGILYRFVRGVRIFASSPALPDIVTSNTLYRCQHAAPWEKGRQAMRRVYFARHVEHSSSERSRCFADTRASPTPDTSVVIRAFTVLIR